MRSKYSIRVLIVADVRNSPPTSCGTILAQSAAAKFATHERRTRVANDLAAVLALIHFVASSAIKSIAAIADPDFMVCLELVAPMTSCRFSSDEY